jgi:formylglycine-generating enzyme required for sulfatase activity
MNGISLRLLQFDRFCVDLARGSLRSGDQDIPLRPKSFDVLCHLARNAGRLVSKGELDQAIWPNVAVTDASLVQCIRELRDKLGDRERRLIKTVHRRGYMLDAVVTEVDTAGPPPVTEMPAVDAASQAAETIADRSSVAAEPPPAVPKPVTTGRKGSIPSWAVATALVFLLAASGGAYSLIRPALLSTFAQSDADTFTVFRDCDECPEMIVLPAGGFDMGLAEEGASKSEGSLRRVTIPRPIAVGRFEITVGQFASFVDQARLQAGRRCNIVVGSGTSLNHRMEHEANFREQPGVEITASHPAACISWHDAKAYVAWLARRTGKPYRLLSEAEWEYAARGGTSGEFSFEGGAARICEFARFADLDSPFPDRSTCHSNNSARGPLPVGSLKPNPWGLYDVHGNVWEWVEDCWSNDPELVPVDGTALKRSGDCEVGVLRGGSWISAVRRLNVGFRFDNLTRARHHSIGLRVGLTIER